MSASGGVAASAPVNGGGRRSRHQPEGQLLTEGMLGWGPDPMFELHVASCAATALCLCCESRCQCLWEGEVVLAGFLNMAG